MSSSTLLAWAASRLAGAKAPCDCGRNGGNDDAAPAATPPPRTTLALPGYGILFFHQLGMLSHLRDRGLFATSNVYESLVGSSAGALAAVLVACDVCPDRAVRAAHALCDEAGLYGDSLSARLLRPAALMGRWGALVRRWLEELLPHDAHTRAEKARCRVAAVRLSAAALPLRFLSTELLTSFASRSQLIDALAASAHVPLFMDGKLWATVDDGGHRSKRRRLIDGSFLHLLLGPSRGGLLPPTTCPSCSSIKRKVVVLDPFLDQNLSWGLLQCLALPSLDSALALAAKGKAHAAELERRGVFDGLLLSLGHKEEKDDAAGGEAITVLAGAGGTSASLASSGASSAASASD
jgi:hypothetical protein